jgi:hypothetical protein
MLAEIDGLVFCLQATRTPIRYGPSIYFSPESVQALQLAYTFAQKLVGERTPHMPVYVAPSDRLFSMLFDNDSSATVRFLSIGGQIDVCILSARLGMVNYTQSPVDVIPNIQGVWAGTMYWREFQTPDNKPYLFLGRHRVLIKADSLLEAHLKALVKEKRFAAIASVINLLKEDEAGHKPPSLANIL